MTVQKLILVFIILSFTHCLPESRSYRLQHGDILFQDLDCGPLCDAIEAVTDGAQERDFSHCGLIIKEGDSIAVLEAIGHSVHTTSLRNFLRRSGDTVLMKNSLVGRLKKIEPSVLNKALELAKGEIGKPYDDSFYPNNGAWYCSELIAWSFNQASGRDIFPAHPMTFRNPKNGEFYEVWKKYYDSLKTTIPEGLPGYNPGAMSRSEEIFLFKVENPLH